MTLLDQILLAVRRKVAMDGFLRRHIVIVFNHETILVLMADPKFLKRATLGTVRPHRINDIPFWVDKMQVAKYRIVQR